MWIEGEWLSKKWVRNDKAHAKEKNELSAIGSRCYLFFFCEIVHLDYDHLTSHTFETEYEDETGYFFLNICFGVPQENLVTFLFQLLFIIFHFCFILSFAAEEQPWRCPWATAPFALKDLGFSYLLVSPWTAQLQKLAQIFLSLEVRARFYTGTLAVRHY